MTLFKLKDNDFFYTDLYDLIKKSNIYPNGYDLPYKVWAETCLKIGKKPFEIKKEKDHVWLICDSIKYMMTFQEYILIFKKLIEEHYSQYSQYYEDKWGNNINIFSLYDFKEKGEDKMKTTILKSDLATMIKTIDHVEYDNPETTIFWANGAKTSVKIIDEPFDPEKGLAMAICKYLMGNTKEYYQLFKTFSINEETKRKTKEIKRIQAEICHLKQKAKEIEKTLEQY